MSVRETARQPEDVTRLFVERVNSKDLDGLVELYEPDAVLGFPPGQETIGQDAIGDVYRQLLAAGPRFELEEPLPTLRFEDLALTSTRAADGTGGRVQVLRRQPDGSWRRIIDRPELPR